MFRRFFPGVVLAICLALEGGTLATSSGQPANEGVRRYVLGEIAGDVTVGQSFAVRADGLSSVTIHPRVMTGAPSGSATLALRDVSATPPTVVAQANRELSSVAQEEAFSLRFPRQPSLGRRYELILQLSNAPRGHGVGLLATRGDGFGDGHLLINRRERWGDLVFETSVSDARTNFATLASRLGGYGVPAAAVVLAVIVIAQNSALFLLLTAIIARHPHA